MLQIMPRSGKIGTQTRFSPSVSLAIGASVNGRLDPSIYTLYLYFKEAMTMSEKTEDTFVTQDMIHRKGVWGGEKTSPPVSASDIRKWAIATYWPGKPPAIYWNEEYAESTSHGGIIAPPDFNPFAWPVERVDRGRSTNEPNPAANLTPSGGKPRRSISGMNGGQTDTYGVPMRPGDIITSRTRLKDWNEREGRLGLTLYTFTETEWLNQNGDHVRTRISTSIRY